jgi:UDP-N-acetylmuramoyl-tripeptide--D-alanyl-D-alanine ligase
VRWTPESLAAQAEGQLRRRSRAPIAGAFIDSRSPRPGALFVPIVAARDGHDFLDAAIAGGATAVLVARGRSLPAGEATVVEVDDTLAALTRLAARSRDRVSGPVVAITGSNGKTTTRAMVEAVLASALPEVLCTRGNLNNHLGVPLTLLDAPHEPRAMVIELGMSAPGENDHLARIVRPTAALITSIALEHLEFMGSLEAIAAAEAEVVPHVAEDGIVVVPSDEPTLVPHLPRTARPVVVRFGPDDAADVRVLGVELGERTEATLRLPGGERVVLRLRLFGAHNARNAAAALAVGTRLGLPLGPMLAALEAVEPVGDRGRVHAWGEHLVIADCYNANPGSMEAALASLAALRRHARAGAPRGGRSALRSARSRASDRARASQRGDRAGGRRGRCAGRARRRRHRRGRSRREAGAARRRAGSRAAQGQPRHAARASGGCAAGRYAPTLRSAVLSASTEGVPAAAPASMCSSTGSTHTSRGDPGHQSSSAAIRPVVGSSQRPRRHTAPSGRRWRASCSPRANISA